MRKVELNMNEELKYKVIKKLVETNGNKINASIKLNLSVRQINRLIKVFKEKGKVGFIHGNKGKTSNRKVSDVLKRNIIDLYKNKYYDANIKHFTKLLYVLEIFY